MNNQNPLTAGREALLARLSTISVADGYLTNVGANVHSGWLNEVIKAQTVAYPLLVVQPGRGQPPAAGPGAIKLQPGFRIVGAVEAGTSYESALEDLQLDVMRCLLPGHKNFLKWLPLGVTGIQFGTPDAFPPGDGLSCATFLLPVYLTTLIQQ
ncbi:hypothetical protein [Metapseudomonas furukawaii]|uniref:Phage protein n=1 Tax=Metapseudomonas furukawaii TaxID=1149133 RepID=A0AAD1C3H6_METFU|nr:hypothetical protein [Pseudomonas furukawaii]ELS25678.1 hypothetical protein ppKF707_0774 [Pseudomonas furukawaii]BAU76133.1 phage protein [Pseudomonas furukawaii]